MKYKYIYTSHFSDLVTMHSEIAFILVKISFMYI